MKNHHALCLCVLAACTLGAIEPGQPDPRVRTFVTPTRVVWTSGTTGYNNQSAVVNAESLLKPRYGQIPEVQWGRQVGAYWRTKANRRPCCSTSGASCTAVSRSVTRGRAA